MQDLIKAIETYRKMAKAWRERGYEKIAREHEQRARELETHLMLAYQQTETRLLLFQPTAPPQQVKVKVDGK